MQFLQSKLQTRFDRPQRIVSRGRDFAMTHSSKKRKLERFSLKRRQRRHLFAQIPSQIGTRHFGVAIKSGARTCRQLVELFLITIFDANVSLPPAESIDGAPTCN